MRILRNLALGTAAVIVIFLVMAIADGWERAHMHYPSPENESAFLRTYSLKSVVEPYIAPPRDRSESDASGGGAGKDSVSHTADLSQYFCIHSEQKGALMVAVSYDLAQRLQTSGARILSQSGTSSDGFKFKYISGNSVGTAFIKPVAPGRVHRNMPLPSDVEDVAVTVDIEETYFSNGVFAEVVQRLPKPVR